jgi:hypothetical protein
LIRQLTEFFKNGNGKSKSKNNEQQHQEEEDQQQVIIIIIDSSKDLDPLYSRQGLCRICNQINKKKCQTGRFVS